MNTIKRKLTIPREKKTTLTVRGVGIDIEEVGRFRMHAAPENKAFYKKIFTDQEIDYCMAHVDPYPHFTARFVAKEAVAKAVGMTMFELDKIEITNEASGRPTVRVHSHPECAIEISLSHTKDRAAAVAIWSTRYRK